MCRAQQHMHVDLETIFLFHLGQSVIPIHWAAVGLNIFAPSSRLTDSTKDDEDEPGMNNRIVKSDILTLNSSETCDGGVKEHEDEERSLCLRNLKSPSQKTFVCAHSGSPLKCHSRVDGDDETDS